MRVSYQGLHGAYSEAAMLRHWGNNVEPVPVSSLEDVFSSVEEGESDAGFVPVENTIEGSITRTYDLLYERSLRILGESVFRISHCLIAFPGVNPDEIRRVFSHPQALGQTRIYLASHGYEPVNHSDTAGAVKMIRDERMHDAAAVASRRAAEIYGMSILAEGIEDNPENYTRFLYVGRGSTKPTGRDKTSIAFLIDNKPGTFIAVLRVLADRCLNITNIESRPFVGRPWEYVFFIDFEGHVDDPISSEALHKLESYAGRLKVLGSYSRV